MTEEKAVGIMSFKNNFLNSAKMGGLYNNLYFSRNPLQLHLIMKNFPYLKEDLAFSKGKGSVLDFGHGFGIVHSALSSLYGRVTTADINRVHRDSAKIVFSLFLPNVKLVIFFSEDKFEEVPNRSFDAIVTDNLLEHLLSPLQINSHFSRILRFEGIVVLSFPSEDLIYRIFVSQSDVHLTQTKRWIDDFSQQFRSVFKEVFVLGTFAFFRTRTYKLIERGVGNR